MSKKLIAEAIGTATLVILGCGTAMLVGCDAAAGGGYILTALAFGLTIVAMAYSIGNISGCHINPAVSLGVLLSGGMDVGEFIGYVIAQCVGAICGSAVLAAIFGLGHVTDMTGGFGANGLAGVGGNVLAGLLVEIVLTFIFVIAILGVTSKRAGHGSFGGLVIGLTLVVVHILGIGLTGTSVNPARSFAPRCSPPSAATSHPWAACGCSSSAPSWARPWRLSPTTSCRTSKPNNPYNRLRKPFRGRLYYGKSVMTRDDGRSQTMQRKNGKNGRQGFNIVL